MNLPGPGPDVIRVCPDLEAVNTAGAAIGCRAPAIDGERAERQLDFVACGSDDAVCVVGTCGSNCYSKDSKGLAKE